MKIRYRGCTYRLENLSDDLKKLMAKEIEIAKLKAEKNKPEVKRAYQADKEKAAK